ncbi:unnamed protein product [Peniophora sp. CBMAI 1063]|nr:unnamed protein product [Peniophora sp. CBMAI 1063]
MSLLLLPKEIRQRILLEVVSAILAKRDARNVLPFPDSLLPPLSEAEGSGFPGSFGKDPIIPYLAHVNDRISIKACTSLEGSLSGQTQYCYQDHPRPSDEQQSRSILALLCICRQLREDLIDFQAFWSQIALLYPCFLPDSLNWAGNGSVHPYRLETAHGLCACALPMILPRVHRASHLSLSLPLKPWYGTHPSEQIFERLAVMGSPRIQHIQLCYDSYEHALEVVGDQSMEIRSLLTFCGVNNPIVAWGPNLTSLKLASTTEKVELPVGLVLAVVRQCLLLEVLSLQTVLSIDETDQLADEEEEVTSTTPPIALVHLRFFLLCDNVQMWTEVWQNLAVPPFTSLHPDIVIGRLDQLDRDYDDYAEEAISNGFDGHCVSCRVVVVDYHQTDLSPGWDRVPEYIRFAFSPTKYGALKERDPSSIAVRSSLTLRFRGIALDKRYPYSEGIGDMPQPTNWLDKLFNGLSKGTRESASLDLTTTETLVIKAGGRTRNFDDFACISQTFPNIHTLVLHGVMDTESRTAIGVISELSKPTTPWSRLQRVWFPDWDPISEVGEHWNLELRDRSSRISHRDIHWLTVRDGVWE